jgi:hypothetical protein
LDATPERIVLTRIRGEIERQLQDSGAPEEVHGFLAQHWARLMTNIFMAKGNRDPDWQAGWDTMNALLWSLAPKQGRKETTLMLRTLPNLLARLQEGCTALGLSASERDAFFQRLAMLHAAVARAGLHGEAVTSQAEILEKDAQSETDVDLSTLPSPLPVKEPALGVEEPMAGHGLPDLKVGSRIRLRTGLEDKVLLLNWLSPMGGMYLFTNEEGLDALTLTRARLESKFRRGEAQLLA